MNTTAGHGPAPRRAVRPKTGAEKAVLRARAGRGGVHHRRRRSRQHPAGTRAGRAEHAARRPRRRGVRGGAGPGGRVRPVARRRRARPSWPPGPGTADPRPAGDALVLELPVGRRSGRCPTTPIGGQSMNRRPRRRRWRPTSIEGLRRLKLAAMRRLAPELLVTAKTQRWTPEELLRTLVEAEIAARDASNARTRLKTAAFPVTKTLDEFDLTVSSIPKATLDYLASLEWITATGEPLPGRTGRHRQESPARRARRRRRAGRAPGPLLHRRRPRRDPLPRPGRQQRRPGDRHPAPPRLDHLRRGRASRRWMTPAHSCCSVSSPPPTNAAPWASPATGPSSPGAGSCPSTPPPSACSTGCCTTPTS